jgi:hypothetical protein
VVTGSVIDWVQNVIGALDDPPSNGTAQIDEMRQ